MAVTLPDFASVGVIDPRSVGTQPTYPQNSAVAEGEAALGKGVSAAGGAIEDVAAYSLMAKNRMDRAMADADFTGRIIPLTEQLKKETDPEKITQLRSQFQTALDTSGQAIADPTARQLWQAQQQKHVATGQAEADLRNTVVYRDRYKAGIRDQLDNLVRTGATATDPTAFALTQDNISHLTKSGQESGSLSAEEGYAFRKTYTKQLIEGRALSLINQGQPDAAVSLLEQHATDLDPITIETLKARAEGKADGIATDTAANRALGMAPRAGGNPGSLAMAAAAVDPAIEAAVAKKIATTSGLQHWAGIDPDTGKPWNPTLRAAFEAAGLPTDGPISEEQWKKADPLILQHESMGGQNVPNYRFDATHTAGGPHQITNTTWKAFGGPELMAGKGSATAQPIPTGPAGQPTAQESQPNRTGLPTLGEIYQSLQADPSLKNDRQRDLAFNKAKTIYSAMEADAARSDRLAVAQQKQALEQRTNEIWADVYGPQPKITAQQIAVDPAFNGNPERRKAMIELINNPPGSGIPAPQSYAAAQALVDRIRLPYGNENKITTPDQVYANIRSLNRPDLEFVLKTLDNSLSPTREKFSAREKAFLDGVKPEIDRSGVMPGLPNDGKGRLKYYEFQNALDTKIDAYLKGGKDPNDLLDPSKPDYMGKPESLKPYRRSISEALADFQNDMQGGAAAANAFGPGSAVDLSKIGSLGDMQAAVKKDPSLRDRAIAISIEKGWIAPPAAAPLPGLAPPIAQP